MQKSRPTDIESEENMPTNGRCKKKNIEETMRIRQLQNKEIEKMQAADINALPPPPVPDHIQGPVSTEVLQEGQQVTAAAHDLPCNFQRWCHKNKESTVPIPAVVPTNPTPVAPPRDEYVVDLTGLPAEIVDPSGQRCHIRSPCHIRPPVSRH
eukprot:1578616-Amphidinium_carterae.2